MRATPDMFGSHFFEDLTQGDSGENTKEVPKRPKSPPRTCDEWFCRAGISQWPSHSPDEALDITDARCRVERGGKEVVMGSLEEIRSDLEAHSRKWKYLGGAYSQCAAYRGLSA